MTVEEGPQERTKLYPEKSLVSLDPVVTLIVRSYVPGLLCYDVSRTTTNAVVPTVCEGASHIAEGNVPELPYYNDAGWQPEYEL